MYSPVNHGKSLVFSLSLFHSLPEDMLIDLEKGEWREGGGDRERNIDQLPKQALSS